MEAEGLGGSDESGRREEELGCRHQRGGDVARGLDGSIRVSPRGSWSARMSQAESSREEVPRPEPASPSGERGVAVKGWGEWGRGEAAGLHGQVVGTLLAPGPHAAASGPSRRDLPWCPPFSIPSSRVLHRTYCCLKFPFIPSFAALGSVSPLEHRNPASAVRLGCPWHRAAAP